MSVLSSILPRRTNRKNQVLLIHRPYHFALPIYGYGPNGVTADSSVGVKTHVVSSGDGNPASLCRYEIATVPMNNDEAPRNQMCQDCVTIYEYISRSNGWGTAKCTRFVEDGHPAMQMWWD